MIVSLFPVNAIWVNSYALGPWAKATSSPCFASIMRYKADVPHAQLLGTNPWADVGITLPPAPGKVQ